MPIHHIKLLKKETIALDTVMFHFEKPENFNFIPGQYGGFTLVNPTETDEKGNTRRFSLASSPADDTLAFLTRINLGQASAYKRQLAKLNIGDSIKFAGPTGLFTLSAGAARPVVMIAGGVGIAPFYSMLNDEARQNMPRPITLFYGNQSPQHAAFLATFHAIESKQPSFKMIATMDHAQDDWQGELGFINANMLKKYLPDIMNADYYVCGSPTMVTLMQEMLLELNIPNEQIKVEDFPGY